MSIEIKRDHAQLQPTCNIPEQSGDKQMPLSKQASTRIASLSAAYTSELTSEARTIARREQTDDVSEKHVNAARDRLFACDKRQRTKGISNIAAGVFLGSALALLISSSLLLKFQTHIMWGCVVVGILFVWHSSSD